MAGILALCQQFALVTAAIFVGAAVYVSMVEQPARLHLDDRSLLTEWKPSYQRGFLMQASLALVSALFGLAAFWISRDGRWLLGALLIFGNWPYTVFILLPVNKRLEATPLEHVNARTRDLIMLWGIFHAGRSVLGLGATVVYLWAMH
jgi:Domain of unknown function (DUF1772)